MAVIFSRLKYNMGFGTALPGDLVAGVPARLYAPGAVPLSSRTVSARAVPGPYRSCIARFIRPASGIAMAAAMASR